MPSSHQESMQMHNLKTTANKKILNCQLSRRKARLLGPQTKWFKKLIWRLSKCTEQGMVAHRRLMPQEA
jgi:hypothetical protein